MASLLCFTCRLPLFREQSNNWPVLYGVNLIGRPNVRLQKWFINAVSQKTVSQVKDGSFEENAELAPKKTERTPRRSRKKATTETPSDSEPFASSLNGGENAANLGTASTEESRKSTRRRRKKVSGGENTANIIQEEESTITTASTEASKKAMRRVRKEASSPPSEEEGAVKKVTRRRRGRKRSESNDKLQDQSTSGEVGEADELHPADASAEQTQDLKLGDDDGEDISYTYCWPPLICCFGAAHYSFIPSGRPANRLIDYEIHEAKEDMFWHPSKFVRAPGGSSSSVALAIASLGGRVAFMGKLGDDEYGQNILYHLNLHNVQTRSIMLDESKATAASRMKINKKGDLRASCTKQCAEDCLMNSEINIDVLKEAKMFYFNSSSLLEPNMRSTTIQAVEAAKKLGEVIFFDLNLPLPLWYSSEETKALIQQAWNHADVIEVTMQELEFLCGIQPSEKFDTKDNNKSKYIHYKREIIMPLWHDNLKVLFMTNGTSKIHYYTEKDSGSVHGMEDAPITPFTGDMSASGDAIVAALMRMITVQPHLITDKGYLEHMIKYAIDCGVIDQWLLARIRGFPLKGEMEGLPTGYGRVRSITEREYRTAGVAE